MAKPFFTKLVMSRHRKKIKTLLKIFAYKVRVVLCCKSGSTVTRKQWISRDQFYYESRPYFHQEIGCNKYPYLFRNSRKRFNSLFTFDVVFQLFVNFNRRALTTYFYFPSLAHLKICFIVNSCLKGSDQWPIRNRIKQTVSLQLDTLHLNIHLPKA